jgi:methanogenic corrinoid protein MtbC1
VAGFKVYDLGRDVPLEKFVEEQLRTDSEIVCISAMMTTTMNSMSDIIKKIKAKNSNVRIMIGGAPLNEQLASKWGADGYAADAPNAIKYAIKLVNALKELTS